ncbi:MAG TPA: TetR/AcrR family transcriptional regulator [Bacillota bacterium]|nr:TetR/AcrR family transcriptional regulator [Bacillota bacterium]
MVQESRREKERQAREAEIVAAAERIFYQKGFDGASMDEVAQAAQFTKRTIYQYFPSKEELYLAVALKGFQQLMSYFETAIAKGATGFEKIHLSGLAYYQFYKDHPDTFRLMNHCKYLKTGAESPKHQSMHDLDSRMFQMFAAAIETGKQDESIRSDLDPMKGAYFVVSVSIGFLQLLSETGQIFVEHYGVDREEFIRFSLDLLCDAIRG